MKIRFSIHVDREAKTLEILVVCTECGEEMQMAKNDTTLNFVCGNHGNVGTAQTQEFLQAFENAQSKVAEAEGFGKLVRINEYFIPAGPSETN